MLPGYRTLLKSLVDRVGLGLTQFSELRAYGRGGGGEESEAMGRLYTNRSEEGASSPPQTLPALTPALSMYLTFKAGIRVGLG